MTSGWWRPAVLMAGALAAGWVLGWFAVGPLIGLYLGHGGRGMQVPAVTMSAPPSPHGRAPHHAVPRHRASLSPVPAVPAPWTSWPAVTYAPPPARSRPSRTPTFTPTPARTPTTASAPTPTPTPSPSLAPSALPSDSPTGTPTPEMPASSP